MKISKYILIFLVIIIIISVYIWSISIPPSQLELYVFDTKGKAAIFIRTPDDTRILINGGANSEIIRRLTKIIPFYSRRIDTVILTSDNGNNVSGLIDIVNRYKIGQIIIPKITAKGLGLASSTDKIFETFMTTVQDLSIPIKEISNGNRFEFTNKLSADVLFPVLNGTSTEDQFEYSKASPPELVLKITYGQNSFLLIGDVSTKIQKYIISILEQKPSTSLLSDVLIIPHSVSASSLTEELIKSVKPIYVIYSQSMTGLTKNSKSNKLDPLYMILSDHRFNIKQKNTIKVKSDGKSIKVE